MIDASSSQVVLRVTAQMLQFARALAVDERDWAELDWTGERTVYYQISTPGGASSRLGKRLPSNRGRQRMRATLDVSSALSCSAFPV